MNEVDLHSYYASQAAYGSSKHHNLLLSKGYQQDPSLSSYNYRTYHRPDRTIVSYKGTNPLHISDLKADIAIGTGTQKSNPEFQKAFLTAKQAKEKYKNQIITTGHSLGGTKAIEAANAINAQSVAFNPGTGIKGLETSKHKVYVNEGDIIAARTKGTNVTKVKGTVLTPLKSHSLNSFENTFQPKRQRFAHLRKKRYINKF